MRPGALSTRTRRCRHLSLFGLVLLLANAAPRQLAKGDKKKTAGASPRVAWVHIPKCGSPFGLTLVYYVANQLRAGGDRRLHDSVGLDVAQVEQEQWFRDAFWTKGWLGYANHNSISRGVAREWKGHFFANFRHPARRAQSAYHHFGGGGLSPRAYAELVAGSATKVVAGQMFGLSCVWPRAHGCWNASAPDVALAVRRLDDFAFVGLTDEWDLSICLFHAKFGGTCFREELETSNSRNSSAEDMVDGMAFAGYVDPFDWQLYAAAQRRFARDLARYNVTAERCARLCPGFGWAHPYVHGALHLHNKKAKGKRSR